MKMLLSVIALAYAAAVGPALLDKSFHGHESVMSATADKAVQLDLVSIEVARAELAESPKVGIDGLRKTRYVNGAHRGNAYNATFPGVRLRGSHRALALSGPERIDCRHSSTTGTPTTRQAVTRFSAFT